MDENFKDIIVGSFVGSSLALILVSSLLYHYF